MRKTYYTDLSDNEWARIEPHLPSRKPPGDLGYTLPARFLTLSSMCSVAAVPGGFCRTTSRLGRPRPSLLLQDLAARWGLGAAKHHAARALAGAAGEKPQAQRGNGRFTIGQDDRGGRRSAGLRRWKESSRQKAPFVGGHRGVSFEGSFEGQGPQRQGPRPRRHQVGIGDRT